MEKLLKILNDIQGGVDYASHKTLIDDCILDSFGIVSLIAEISDTYGIQIPPEEIVPENFNSASSIKTMLDRLAEESL